MRLLTPRGVGGVAVIELAGPAWRPRAAELLSVRGRPLDPASLCPGRPRLATLVVGGRPLDQVLVIELSDPSRVELHVHGSEAVIEALDRGPGLLRRRPDPAEQLLRHSASDAQLALGLEQRSYDFDAFLGSLARLPAAERRRAVDQALARSAVALALAEPQRLVLCGSQNAGKSTLMNRLLARERALVGETAGLTRDPVAELTCLAGYPYELVDTAGEGEVASEVDRSAQQLGRRRRRGALRILVVDGSRGPDEADAALVDDLTLVVVNKDDLPRAPWVAPFAPHARISCLDPAGFGRIRAELGELLTALRRLPPAGPVGGVAALSEAGRAALVGLREGDTPG